MKKIIIVFVFFLLSSLLRSQDYHPFPTSDAIWKVMMQHVESGANITEVTRYYEIVGEDLIQGEYYSLLNERVHTYWTSSGNTSMQNLGITGAIREDSLKHVFYLFGGTEYLLYDFNLEIGDTIGNINMYNMNNYGGYIIDEIDSVLVADTFHRRFVATAWYNDDYQFEIIEGVGSTIGLLGESFGDWNWHRLLCLKHYDLNAYPNGIECSVVVDDSEIETKEIDIFPNPSDGKIKIRNLPAKQGFIQVFDIYGIKVYEILYDSDVEVIDLKVLSPGIYFLIFSNEDSEIVEKILID